MKTKRHLIQICLLGAVLLLPAVVQAQFTFTTNNGAITITGYTGSGAVVIPSTTNGYPVTSIADQAFAGNRSITDVTIPYSITNIGDDAFLGQVTAFNVDVNNTNYSSLAGVLFDKQQATLIAYRCSAPIIIILSPIASP